MLWLLSIKSWKPSYSLQFFIRRTTNMNNCPHLPHVSFVQGLLKPRLKVNFEKNYCTFSKKKLFTAFYCTIFATILFCITEMNYSNLSFFNQNAIQQFCVRRAHYVRHEKISGSDVFQTKWKLNTIYCTTLYLNIEPKDSSVKVATEQKITPETKLKSPPLTVGVGLRQSRVLSPLLFIVLVYILG